MCTFAALTRPEVKFLACQAAGPGFHAQGRAMAMRGPTTTYVSSVLRLSTDRFACVLPLLQYACCIWQDVVIFLADLVAFAVEQIANVLPLDPPYEIFYVPSTLRRAHHDFPILSSPGLHFSWHSTHAETVSAKPVGMVSELTLPRVLATRRG